MKYGDRVDRHAFFRGMDMPSLLRELADFVSTLENIDPNSISISIGGNSYGFKAQVGWISEKHFENEDEL